MNKMVTYCSSLNGLFMHTQKFFFPVISFGCQMYGELSDSKLQCFMKNLGTFFGLLRQKVGVYPIADRVKTP